MFLFIALGHSCINPFIYFWTDARVRFGFMDLVGSIPGVKKCCPTVNWDHPYKRYTSGNYNEKLTNFVYRRGTTNHYTISRHNSRMGSTVYRKNGRANVDLNAANNGMEMANMETSERKQNGKSR